jgi:hypothetical protein
MSRRKEKIYQAPAVPAGPDVASGAFQSRNICERGEKMKRSRSANKRHMLIAS